MVGAILYTTGIILVIMALVWSAGMYAEYDPHHDPMFMREHDPMYCPKCVEQRRREGRHY